MSDNMEIWNEVSQPPQQALKEIRGGRLKGMTDINPQWRVKALTELFGPCGVGWKYSIVDVFIERFDSGEAVANAIVHLQWRSKDGKWSEPIPGVGGSGLVNKESSGLRVSDEAIKMAITDALSTAMKYLGVAADIYMGLWDGSKYREQQKEHRWKPGEKEEIYKQVRGRLDDGDSHGIKEIFSEFTDADEKMKVWSIFNSSEKSAIKDHLEAQ